MRIVYWVICTVLVILSAGFLELNKNTFLGWALFLITAAGLIMVSRLIKGKGFWLHLSALAVYLGVMILVIFLSWPPIKPVKAVEGMETVYTEPVTTANGQVRGVKNRDGSVEVFAGIPYAKPPVNDLRWRKPQDPESWNGIRDCDHFAPMSMQEVNLPIIDSLTRIIGYHDYRISLTDQYRPPVSEDSLYLNVWKPSGKQTDLPVIVYIHGGSLKTGQPWYEDYSGESFARDGVVAVNMGYRLGVFGFYADEESLKEEGTTGNFGLLDQIKALEWVRDNIASFGGDPQNVTLVGESAGAVCVDALCVSPLAEGLFQKAIMESSTISSKEPPHSFRHLQDALESGKSLRARHGVSTLQELRRLKAEELVGEQETQHHVCVDGTVLLNDPYVLRRNGVHNETALLHGFNKEESGPFILFDHASLRNYETKVRAFFRDSADEVLALYAPTTDSQADEYWAEIYGALFFNYSHDCIHRLMKDQEPVYQYYFTKSNGRLSSWHSGELIYAFGMIPEDSGLFDESDRNLSRIMHEYWIRFARNGDPNGGDLPVFEQGSDRLMELGEEVRMVDNPFRKLYDILDRMQGFE